MGCFRRMMLACIASAVMTIGMVTAVWAAVPEIPRDEGVAGNVNLGLGMLRYESNLIAAATAADIGRKSASALTVAPGAKALAFPLFSFEMGYTFAQARTQLFAGTEIRDFLILSQMFSLGMRSEVQDLGRFQLALLSTPAGSKVWRDPYVTRVDRTATKLTATGLQLAWDKIMNTNFGISFTSTKAVVDNESSGAALVNDGTLTAAQAVLLNRNGNARKIDIRYAFVPGYFIVMPSFSYIDESLDGKAMANSGYLAALALLAPLGRHLSVAGDFIFGRMTSDTVNPVFGEKYQRNQFGINVDVSYKHPFGLRNWTGSLILAYFGEHNRINFYDANTTLAAISMRYAF